ncbi:hypothetical protein Taro_001246 [Colocasia esculenta]|uniref:Major facilitator superfamily (MFS) profile domain-containing protein n=1 Tax=Colocasia esculenta TaxID=4460 RepID=A0A843TD05_COLES|nr:hypothetical protein [Colocasia esculenta]
MAVDEDVEVGGAGAAPGGGMEEPLLQPRKEAPRGCEEGRGHGEGSIWMTLLCTGVAVCGSFEFGTCVGYSAPTQSGIRRDLGLSMSEAMRMSAAICLVGWLSIYFAQGALSLDFGRLATGYGIGILSYVLLICAGVSLSFIVGTFVTWRTLVLLGLSPCVVLLLGLFFIPESPRWLAKVGRQKEFKVALQRLRGEDTDVSEEALEIQEYLETLQSLPKARCLDLFQRRYIRPVVVAVGLMAFQQLGGINGIGFYASQIFVSAGFPSGDLGTIMMGVIQVSASGTFLGMFLAAVSFYLKEQRWHMDWAPLLALIGILVYIGSFSIGMGAVPWVIMSEIFPINIKGIGGSLVTLVNWFGSWLVSYAFNFLMDWSASGTLFIFSGFCALTVLFIAKVVPETKGRTLEEIQSSMSS